MNAIYEIFTEVFKLVLPLMLSALCVLMLVVVFAVLTDIYQALKKRFTADGGFTGPEKEER